MHQSNRSAGNKNEPRSAVHAMSGVRGTGNTVKSQRVPGHSAVAAPCEQIAESDPLDASSSVERTRGISSHR
jgi:hypothetical protein